LTVLINGIQISGLFVINSVEGKRSLAKTGRRWVDNIKIDLSKIGWNGIDWIGLAQDKDPWKALVNTVMNFRVS
jgi:hypothetical protein